VIAEIAMMIAAGAVRGPKRTKIGAVATVVAITRQQKAPMVKLAVVVRVVGAAVRTTTGNQTDFFGWRGNSRVPAALLRYPVNDRITQSEIFDETFAKVRAVGSVCRCCCDLRFGRSGQPGF
jgi:hypothetical protein